MKKDMTPAEIAEQLGISETMTFADLGYVSQPSQYIDRRDPNTLTIEEVLKLERRFAPQFFEAPKLNPGHPVVPQNFDLSPAAQAQLIATGETAARTYVADGNMEDDIPPAKNENRF